MRWAEIVLISAKTGKRCLNAYDAVDRAREAHLGASARVERRAVSPRDAILGAGSAVREAVMAVTDIPEMMGPEMINISDPSLATSLSGE